MHGSCVCACECAHRCGVWMQRWDGSTRSISQLCESHRCPQGYSGPGEYEKKPNILNSKKLTQLRRTLSYTLTQVSANTTAPHLDKIHRSGSQSSQSTRSLVPDIIHHLQKKRKEKKTRHKQRRVQHWRSDRSIKYQ